MSNSGAGSWLGKLKEKLKGATKGSSPKSSGDGLSRRNNPGPEKKPTKPRAAK